MGARTDDLTVEEKAARYDRMMEKGRLRVAKHRAGRNAATSGNGTANVTAAALGRAGNVTPPRTPPSPPISKEIGELERLLEPYATRGYVHCVEFWQRLAARYPDVDLVLQAMGA